MVDRPILPSHLHCRFGRAVVTPDGWDRDLVIYGSAESRDEYDRA